MIKQKRLKTIQAVLLIFAMLTALLPIGVVAQEEEANDPETVVFTIGQKSYLKGSAIVQTDIAPYIKDIGAGLGRTMVPVAFVAPALGSEPAQWLPNERSVLITKGEKRVQIYIDSKELLVNGKIVQMDVAAEIMDIGSGGGRTMLPIAFIARALEVGHEWFGETREVKFYGKHVVFDKTINYGSDVGAETIEGNVIIKAPNVVLNNLYIKGNLIIAEEVGDEDVTLNNITVKGETFIRGGGKDSIHINGGQYSNITVQNVGGQVRIVALDVNGLTVVIAEEAAGEEIILEGDFESVTIEAENTVISTQGETTVKELVVGQNGKESKIVLSTNTAVDNMILESKAEITGKGNVEKAEIKAEGVTFETAPKEQNVAEGISGLSTIQQPSQDSNDGGGDSSPPAPALPQMGGSVTISGTAKYGETLTADISGLSYTSSADNNVLTYQWKREGTDITGANSTTYTLVQADIGQTISVTVNADGTHATGSVTSGATGAVAKVEGPAAPVAPELLNKTHNSATLTANEEHEFSKDDGVTWQESHEFTGLNAGVAYTFIARVKETVTHQASAASAGTVITTEAAPLVLRKINALDRFPTNIVRGVSFSSDGQYLAAAHTISPHITIYKRAGDTFAKLPNPAELPAGHAQGVSFSNNGNYLAVVHTYAPHLTIYKRMGDTFSKLAVPTGLPALQYPLTDGAYDVAFSHDDTYMAVAHKSGSADKRYLTIFKRDGDTFTKLADPDVVLTDPGTNGSGVNVDFNYDSSLLAVGHGSTTADTGYLTIYSRSGDIFTKLDDSPQVTQGYAYGLAFSSDGRYLAAGHNSPFISVYKIDGGVFSKLTNTGTSPGSLPWGIDFSPDDKYVVMALSNSPYLAYYVRYGDMLLKLDNPVNMPTDQGQDVAYSSDGTYLAVGYAGSPYLTIYKSLDPASTVKAVTNTAIGVLDGGNITLVPQGTKVFELKGALTVSDDSTVEILTWPGQGPVTDQGTTEVTNDMVIEVTAGDGSKAEYSIALVPAAELNNPVPINIGTSNPSTTISLSNSTYTAGAESIENWSINTGSTGLTVQGITLQDAVGVAVGVTIDFTGTTVAGTISFQALAAAVTSGQATNTVEMQILSNDTAVLTKETHYNVVIHVSSLLPADNPITANATVISEATTVGEFLNNMNQPAGSTWKVFANANNPLAGDPPVDGVANFHSRTPKANGDTLADNDLLFVLAEDGSTLRGYHISVN